VTHASSCSHTRSVRLLVRACSADLSLCRGGIGCAYSPGVLSLSLSLSLSRAIHIASIFDAIDRYSTAEIEDYA